MEVTFTLSADFLVAAAATAVLFLFALLAVRSLPRSARGLGYGGAGDMVLERAAPAAAERGTGASMMEQLVPEITTHALSYLDYPSLCRLSMTNSLMRRAANDDNAWKALYHKVRDVRARVLTDMAWVTMKLYVDMETRPFNVTNVFEFHKGRWYMVHHHISLLLEQQIVNG